MEEKIKKRNFKISCALMVLMVSASCVSVFAEADAAQKAERQINIVQNKEELYTPKLAKAPDSITLQEAIKYMKESSNRAEEAKQNRKADKVTSEGYSETVSRISRTQKALDDGESAVSEKKAKLEMAKAAGWVSESQYKAGEAKLAQISTALFQKAYEAQVKGVSSRNKDIMVLRRDFAKAHLETNAQAELNEIESSTIEIYYNVLLAKENYEIATRNVEVQEKTVKLVELKKKEGLVPKKDLLSANSVLASAKVEQREAKTKLDYAKMGFNFTMGFPVTSQIEFKDKISDVVTNDENSLEIGVLNTLKNRQEIAGAKLATDIYTLLLKDVDDYPRSSSTYMSAKLALEEAQKTLKDVPSKLEIDTRDKYNILQNKKYEVESAKKLLEYANEGERLLLLTYEAGVSTIDELLEVQVKRNKAELNLAKAKSDYALSKKAYEYAQGVGVTRLPL
ncbi:MAG: TolC family protein [Eubacteriales bacterium]